MHGFFAVCCFDDFYVALGRLNVWKFEKQTKLYAYEMAKCGFSIIVKVLLDWRFIINDRSNSEID